MEIFVIYCLAFTTNEYLRISAYSDYDFAYKRVQVLKDDSSDCYLQKEYKENENNE